MESVLRELREKDTQLHATYLILLKRLSKACRDAMRESLDGTAFIVPKQVHGRPPYDLDAMVALLEKSLKRSQGFSVVSNALDECMVLYISWDHTVILDMKKHVYSEILRRIKASIDTYITSHFYKTHKMKMYKVTIPPRLYGYERYSTRDAAVFVAEKLSEEGFRVVIVGTDVQIFWDHVV